MNLYAETSAVLAWLFSEKAESGVRTALVDTETVISSDLTLVECDRAIWRAVSLGSLSETDVSGVRGRLAAATMHWNILPLSPGIVERARQRFPSEPIRVLDALHVASALHAQPAFPHLTMLSLDERVRRVARNLGLPLSPS